MFLQEEPHGRNKVFRLKVTTQAVDIQSGLSRGDSGVCVVKIEGLSRPSGRLQL